MDKINRRKFLKGVAAVPLVVVGSKIPSEPGLAHIVTRETMKIPVKPFPVGNHPKAIWPGIDKWFGENYIKDQMHLD